jgi:hypothetical protein
METKPHKNQKGQSKKNIVEVVKLSEAEFHEMITPYLE